MNRIVVGIILLLPLAGCVEPPEKDKKAALTELVKEDLTVGDGEEAKIGDKVKVHYTGRLRMNGKKFDSSLDRNEPFAFTLGTGGVIRGWDEGVPGMKVGGKRKLEIPARMAYGKRGQGDIPPDADLVFEVELLGIVK